jgi:hypothetical protein
MQQMWLPVHVTKTCEFQQALTFQLLLACHVPLSGSSSFSPSLSFTPQGSSFIENLSLYSSTGISTSDLHPSTTPSVAMLSINKHILLALSYLTTSENYWGACLQLDSSNYQWTFKHK